MVSDDIFYCLKYRRHYRVVENKLGRWYSPVLDNKMAPVNLFEHNPRTERDLRQIDPEDVNTEENEAVRYYGLKPTRFG